jgi:hypothetical protein
MTTPPPPPGDSVVRLSTPPDIVRAIPSLLGFHPTGSLVVLGLSGHRRRLQMTLRIDLPDPGSEAGTAEQVAGRLSAESVSACVVVLFTAAADATPQPSAPAQEGGRSPSRGRAFLPGSSAAYAVDDALRDAGLEVRELLRAERGRWWSYLCQGPCCPPGGLPVGSGPTTLLEVLRVAAGRPIFADRAELVASVRRATGEPTDALRAAILAREDALAGEPWGPQAARDLADLHTILTRDAVPADPPGESPGGPVPVHDDRTIAQVAVALTRLAVRDASFAWTGGPLVDTAAALWAELVRRVPPPYAAAPATLLAVSAYRRGDGALADAYLRRALEDDPDYRMADLVLTSLENGFRPTDVESALGLHGASREAHRSTRSAPGPDGGTDAR